MSTILKLQGKTLAFVLPILESVANGPAKASRKIGYGRPPSVLVLLPTRELASQVGTDTIFNFVLLDVILFLMCVCS